MASVNPQLLASPARSDSLRSVSSSHSAVSLTRRSRVRTRSGNLTNTRGRSSGPPGESEKRANHMLDELNATYPLKSPMPGPSGQNTLNTTPPRPIKSPQRIKPCCSTGNIAPNAVPRRPATTETSIGIGLAERGRNQTAGPSKLKGIRRPRSLPRQPQSVSSDSSSQLSPVTPVGFNTAPVMGVRHNQGSARDSSLSQRSCASSSLYPPSSPTVSNQDQPLTPVSQKGKERDDGIPFETDNGYQEFDADDVSLRLRLLVNNNYFLPPAHSKPSAADFASSSANAKKPIKAPSPSFLDIFRIGKSKSKPTTPVTPNPPVDLPGLRLRTNSDSMTAANFLHAQSLPQTPIVRTAPLTQQGRVVVVREKMDDLIGAAKQAEQDSKNEGDYPSRNSRRRDEDYFDGVIDPTDAVDLPPPSTNYPFALQASAMQGLGIQDSVGAAVLADRLPPSQSPGLWSLTTDEENWRKGILQQAIGHSFNNTPATSFTRKSSRESTRTDESAVSANVKATVSTPPEPIPASELPVGQPIIPQAVLNRHVQHSPSMSRLNVGRSDLSPNPRLLRMYSAPEFQHGSPNLFNPPTRAETPVLPATPLTPAPRKHIVNPVYSLSQSDLGEPPERGSPEGSIDLLPGVRNSISSPRLSDIYETGVNTGRSIMSPPPVFVRGPEGSPMFPYRRSLGSETSGSRYFDDDDQVDEAWYGTTADTEDPLRLSTSLPTSTRPSFSEYPSPTASAFRDALFDDGHSLSAGNGTGASGQSSFVSAVTAPRYSMASPPPRASMSFLPHVLPPPPRRIRRPRSSPDRSSTIPAESLTILGPEPSTPPIPISQSHGNQVVALHITTPFNRPAIKSVPPRSSISFFDNIQSDLHTMDEDYDSSSDDGDHHQPQQNLVFINPRTTAVPNRPSTSSLSSTLMRLGNNSTPQLGSSTMNAKVYPAFDPHLMKAPIANVPAKPAFFSSKKGGKGKQGISPLDFVPHPTPSSSLSGHSSECSLEGRKSSGSGVSHNSGFVIRASQDESTRNLDGMVMRHLEAERDALKRLVAANNTNAKAK